MKITETESIFKYLIDAKIIGIGTTAICFLLPDNQVLKLYYNSYNKRHLFYHHNMLEHLKLLNSVTNDTYIGPEELLINNGKVTAYLYPYINDKTLHASKNFITLNEIITKYPKVESDTDKISKNNFLINDLHDRNILIGNKLSIIDLDRGYIDEDLTVEKIYQRNMNEINQTIIQSLFNIEDYEIIEFKDSKLNNLYKESTHSAPNAFIELLEQINEQCYPQKSTSKVLRKKILYSKKQNSYWKYY